METDATPSDSLARRLADLLPLFGVLAAVSYAVLRVAYLQFYYSFMVSPEEVGLGQAELLTQSLVAPLFLFIVAAIAAIFLGFLLALMSRILKPLARPLSNLRSRLPTIGHFEFSRPNNTPKGVARPSNGEAIDANEPVMARGSNDTGRGLTFEASALVALVLLSFVTSLFIQANAAVTGVQKGGYTITTVHFGVGPVDIPSLNIIAWPNAVEWKEGTKTPSSLKQNSNCIMYLGKANGTTVIYNVKTRMTIRFRSDDAIVAVYPLQARLAPSCYE
ncbi:MAG TPA: hypothetical protein VJ140_06790 [Actinomycetota bacterium]|nr:hypothetical protein [Actinomycetota bacterium]